MMTQVYFSINNAIIKVLFFVETSIMVEQNQNSRPVLLACNADGSDELLPLQIGKYACFRWRS
jgi:hypothetical protein